LTKIFINISAEVISWMMYQSHMCFLAAFVRWPHVLLPTLL